MKGSSLWFYFVLAVVFLVVGESMLAFIFITWHLSLFIIFFQCRLCNCYYLRSKNARARYFSAAAIALGICELTLLALGVAFVVVSFTLHPF